ncbi:MAG: hypothetical protein PHW64_03425 [Sulfuricurvum sp.]|nr:hypothetical protein [Sulfuricurvum sp.]
MKTYTLTYECTFNTSVQNVCAFHTDTRNLPFITPPLVNVTILEMDIPMVEKSTVVLKIKRFGIPTIWEMKIDTLNCPHTITDVMIKGPFKYFRHERFFSAMDEKTTRMKETLSIVLPFGWLGSLFFPLIKREMDAMFTFRHHATQHYFSEEKR